MTANLAKADTAMAPAHGYTMTEMVQMANVVYDGKLFGGLGKAEILTLLLVAQAEGRHPMNAMLEYDVIKKKPALKSQAMLARFQRAGGSVQWLTMSDTVVSAQFSHPQGGKLVVEWTIERAKQMELTGKDNWRKQPMAMLSARCASEGVRRVYPACLTVGFYTPEEVRDFTEPEPRDLRREATALTVEADMVREDAPNSLVAHEMDEAADKLDKRADKIEQRRETQPERTETPVMGENPAARAIPLGEPIQVNLSAGERVQSGAIRWKLEYNGGYIVAYCWHKNQPVEATGQEDPENYDGPAIVLLSKNAEGYFIIDEITGVSND